MKTSSLVVASVLLAGVALEIAAFSAHGRTENENLQWMQNAQSDWEVSSNNDDIMTLDEIYNNNNNNRFNERIANTAEQLNNRRENNKNYYSSNENLSNRQQLQYSRRNQLVSSDITKTIVDKIAAMQKILIDRPAETINNLDDDLKVNKNIIKMSGHHFVMFYNATMKSLESGKLESLYINPNRDTVSVQYKFDRLNTIGSFKSNDANYKSGYFTIVLNKVNSAVMTGFRHNPQRSPMEPARFVDADANILTENGTEVQVFNDALEHRYLRVLGNAVSNEVLLSTDRGMIAQLKDEVRRPTALAGAKLFDMKWTEDDVTMEMPNVGFRDLATAGSQSDRLFNSLSLERKSENAYSMRYDFALTDLEWSSALTIESAGTTMHTGSINLKIDNVGLRVIILKSLDQQQQQEPQQQQQQQPQQPQQPQNDGCAKVHVDITGFRYNFDDEIAVQSELLAKYKLQHFMKHSLESHMQNSLTQVMCGLKNDHQ